MPYTFDVDTRNQLQLLIDKEQFSNAYQLVSDTLLAPDPVTGIAPKDSDIAIHQSQLWFAGAARVNADIGIFSDFIRDYTVAQGAIRKQVLFSDLDLSLASDNVARAVFGFVPIGQDGILPTIDEIAVDDATEVGNTLFPELTGNPAWSGVVLFPFLGSNQFALLDDPDAATEVFNWVAMGASTAIAIEDIDLAAIGAGDYEIATGLAELWYEASGLADISDIVDTTALDIFSGGLPDTPEELIDSAALGAFVDRFKVGGAGDDTITGDAGSEHEIILGGGGNDSLVGQGGVDFLVGGDGNDSLLGASGEDVLDGGSGDDTLMGGAGADSLRGGAGRDTVSFMDNPNGVRILLTADGKVGADQTEGIEVVHGSAESDYIRMGTGTYTVIGGAGNDLIEHTSIDNDITVITGAGQGTDFVNGLFGPMRVHIKGTETATFYIDNDDPAHAFEGTELMIELPDGTRLIVIGAFGPWSIPYLDSPAVEFVDQNGAVVTSLTLQDVFDQGVENVALIDRVVQDVFPTLRDLGSQGTDGEDDLFGSNRAETIAGKGGDDTITANGGNDTVLGGDGDDWIDGGAGNDALDGGAGIDTALYSSTTAGVTVDLSAGTATGAGIGSDTLTAIENLIGGSGGDILTGDAGANVIEAGGGGDVIEGGAGGDTILAGDDIDLIKGHTGSGNDIYDGGAGTDRVSYEGAAQAVTVDLAAGTASGTGIGTDRLIGIENVTGGAGVDSISGDDNANVLSGDAGGDFLEGRGGDDLLIGGAGEDYFDGGAGNDTADLGDRSDDMFIDLAAGFAGGAEFEQLIAIENVIAGGGGDTVKGDSVANTLDGGAGADLLQGNGGDDYLIGGAGEDFFNGGAGNDTADLSDRSDDMFVDLTQDFAGGVAFEQLIAIENVVGGSGNDFMIGDALANLLDGGAGDDFLTGGAGADVFRFGPGSGSDTVSDFVDLEDVIDVSGFGISSFGELIVFDQGADTFIAFSDTAGALFQGVASAAIDSGDFIFA